MSDNEGQYQSQTAELRGDLKTYVPPSVQDEFQDDRRPTLIPSPPMSEISNPPLTEQQTDYPKFSPGFMKQLAQQVKEILEQPRVETRISEPNSDQSKPELMARKLSNGESCSTSSSPLSPPSPNSRARRATITISSESPPMSPLRSSPSSPKVEKAGVRFTNPRGPADKERGRNVQMYREFLTPEINSPIDQKWGTLFDSDRRPTPRLIQFLKGLANHIIKEFEPKNTIVVTPNKMAKLYENYAVENEAYSMTFIFKSQLYEDLSILYQDLNCQHHLVQEESHRQPAIPGLTPVGFAQWMIKWIMAYPDQEASRLERVVVSLPIDADGDTVDGKPERLPKKISRHLLPSKDDLDTKRTIGEVVSNFLSKAKMLGKKRHSIAGPPGPLFRRGSSPAQSAARPIDVLQAKPQSKGDRMSFSGTPPDTTTNEDATKMGRGKKAYPAKSSGKAYFDGLIVPHATREGRAKSASRATGDPDTEYRVSRTRRLSNASSNTYITGPRPSGPRGPPSPPLYKGNGSNLLNPDGDGSYPPDPFGSPPKQSQSLSSAYYTTSSKYPSDSREYDRERDRGSEPRRRERRGTIDDPSRLPPSSTIPRDAERLSRALEDKEWERDRRYDAKGMSTVIHQELRPEARTSVMPDEEAQPGRGPSRRRV